MVDCCSTLKEHGGFLVESSPMLLMVMRLASTDVMNLKPKPKIGGGSASKTKP